MTLVGPKRHFDTLSVDFEHSHPQQVVLLINLLRVGALLDKEVTDYLSRYGLTGPQVGVLRVLQYYFDRGQDGMALSEIGDRLAVTKANMTGLIDRLERDGLVVRESEPGDRRIKRVRLTPKAHDLHSRLKPGFFQHLGELMSVLDGPEREQLLGSLAKLRRVLGDLSTATGDCEGLDQQRRGE